MIEQLGNPQSFDADNSDPQIEKTKEKISGKTGEQSKNRASKRIIEDSCLSDSSECESEKENLEENISQSYEETSILNLSSKFDTNLNKKCSKKWTSEKYSRSSRKQRKRENVTGQPVISHYFKPIDEIGMLLQKNTELRQQLYEQLDEKTKQRYFLNENLGINENQKYTNFLEMLYKTATNNNFGNKKSKNANRYDQDLKQFCLYLFIIGGRLLYETLYSNMNNALPCISTLGRLLKKQNLIVEGALRFKELCQFLEQRRLPKKVWISEDATKITGRIEYNADNNKIVGFVLPWEGGLPKTESFLAVSASAIQGYFINERRADYAYVVMAQAPVDKSPSFCLTVFGTDNRFCCGDVISRWNSLKKEASFHGIEIMGFSSDGDTRLLKTMRILSTLQDCQEPKWNWFHMDLINGDICVQDTVHIGTKLRSRLLKPNIELTMGNFQANPKHLASLMNCVSKDRHLLNENCIQSTDKMNFRAVEQISNPEVSQLLNQYVPESDGTILYLKIMHSVLTAFLNKNIDIEKRIYLMWYCVFVLRIWREWLRKSNSWSTTKNFITLNCYLCIEINAHSIIKLVQKFRDNEELREVNDFTTWLFSSQPCEQVFRSTRSMTSTFSTVVNFSLQEIMNRLHKIETLVNTTNDLSHKFIFPREINGRLGSSRDGLQEGQKSFPDDRQIEVVCMQALDDAKRDCLNLGITCYETSWMNISVANYNINQETRGGINTQSSSQYNTSQDSSRFVNENDLDNDYLNDDDEQDGTENIIHNITSSIASNDNSLDNSNMITLLEEISEDPEENRWPSNSSDIQQDHNIPKDLDGIELTGFSEELNMKDCELPNVDVESPYVRLKVKEKIITLRKSSLCWLLNNKCSRLSSDRLLRVRSQPSSQSYTQKSYTEINEAPREAQTEAQTRAQTNSRRPSDKDLTIAVPMPLEIINECYYAVYYSEGWYIGKILKSLSKKKFQIKFLKSSLNDYTWPKSSDIQIVDKHFIFFGPINMKGVMPLKITQNDNDTICSYYKMLKRQYN